MNLKRIRSTVSTRSFRIGLSVVMVALVVVVLAREIKPSEIKDAFQHAKLWWVVAAAGASALSWVGAAIPLKSLADIRVPFFQALLVQVSASFVGAVAPAGTGPIALHLEYLKKRGMTAASAVAVVTFIELAQVVTSVAMLLVAILFDHTLPHVSFPLRKVLLIAGIVILLVASLLLVPKIRAQVEQALKKVWKQVQPQIAWVRSHPRDLVFALLGAVLQTGSYAFALLFSLYAVGHPISFAMAITVYLLGNAIRGAVPTPGGIGSTLAATVAALTVIGVPTALAASAVVLFRLVSFYMQVPIGWLAFTYMQRKNLF